ncbi:TPA: class II lanthipeptide, LchA2/BrtA2 family [Bacillus pacificus]|uniref:Class II lanthipeptide, LchA2/BrtA2 family n=1 Tax=Bacillus pacificus TaxID=2026187 RepID=A0AAW6Z7T1_9BACI|nr:MULTISPECIES: class II lanthipeptide, LchA2/BrtA2 family [Bacillus cereus group]MDK7389809.1 class II lanthipeptide, LchA2/BrtA2 family [Bacillus pacificus]MDK7395154.1 class II lanthipeptide, LchA2/BrtA2 family [Bacillus pacificus]MDK7400241.1 class II lanthipeptide, LchA2/BrtA2 family [Bacillus pacificus]MDK7405747.1 class II lanthipeptide, LchA2/BrtA2 family [Bacillus pacificus]MED1588287.1 class II lanthipeptide, LchA2/BrtA2 family [Bacillus pacificus]
MVGLVNEDELTKIVGVRVDVPPELTPVIANMTKNLCSTTPYTTRCL